MRLRTLGGLWIEGDPDLPALGPRRLSLLAIVAAAGRRGVSRDRVLAILWPDTDQELARHTLSQTVYSLKRDTGRDWIVGTPDLRLDAAITSDVGELQQALSSGDLPTAARLYTGKFLDGFDLPGGPEFERWMEEQRTSLHAAVIRAVERLAAKADDDGTLSESVRWWTQLTELDPLSGRYAAGRMRALAAVGDRASALAHARVHEAVIRRELDADLDPTIRQLITTLKQVPGPPDAAKRPPAPPARSAPAAAGPVDLGPAAPEELAVSRAWRATSPWLMPVTVGAVLLLALGAGLLLSSRSDPVPVLAVGEIRTPDPNDTTALGPVLRDMLATSLGALPELQVVANSRLVELMPPGADPAPAGITDAARRAGASEVIEGELSSEPGGLSLSLRRVAVDRGIVRRGYILRAASRTALVDSATAAIARDFRLGAPSVSVSEIRTASPAAYALYEQGLRAYYGFDAPAASRLMSAALEHDSGFAMAAYYAWMATRGWDHEAAGRAFELARRLAPRTIERERLLIQASLGALDLPLWESAAKAETLGVRYPGDPDGQIVLGQVRFAQGDWAGSVAALERAVALDSAAGATRGPYCRVCQALSEMVNAYLWWDSTVAAERAGRRLIALREDDYRAVGTLVEPLLRQGRRAEAERALEESSRISPVSPSFRPMLQRDLIRWGRLEEVDRELTEDLARPFEGVRGEARWLLCLSLRDQGRLREALALVRENRIPNSTSRIAGLQRDSVGEALILLELDPRGAARLFQPLAEARLTWDVPRGHRSRLVTWMFTLAATAHAAAGDTAVVRRLADSVETLGRSSAFGRDLRLHFFLRGLLLQREGRHGEAVDAFHRSLFSLTDGFTRTNLMLARSLLALRRAGEAIAVLRPAIRGGVDGSNTYTSRTELHEALALAFAAVGQRDSSVAHFRLVERGWRHADPEFAERYQRARAAVQQP